MRSPTFTASLSLALLMLAGCTYSSGSESDQQEQASVAAEPEGADSMASQDAAQGAPAPSDMADAEARPVMQAQVVLERLGFSSSVIDGEPTSNFANALKAFQEARDLPTSGTLDDATRQALAQWANIPATRTVTIPEDWGALTFAALPKDPAAQAQLQRLGYESMAEKLAERFHTTPEVLAMLNPVTRSGAQPAGAASASPSATPTMQASAGAGREPADAEGAPTSAFAPGQTIRVPNVGADYIDPAQVKKSQWLATLRSLGVGTRQPKVSRLVVDESEGWLRAYDAGDNLVAAFSVTTGSQYDPLPIGDWKIKGVATNPTFVFNPELFWDVDDSVEKQRLPPGPNSPVGVVWIDLDKEHYGIHGTPQPALIGQTESHGCVRLANWDAARLAQMVSGGTKVVFQK